MASLVYYVGEGEERAAALDERVEGVRVERVAAPPSPEEVAAPSVACVVCEDPLPGRTGLAVLEEVADVDPDLPTVLYPAYGDESLAAAAIAADVDGYVPRTVDGDELPDLADRVAALVEEYRTERVESRLVDRLPGIAYRARTAPGWSLEYVAGNCEGLTGYPAAALLSDEVTFGEDLIHPSDRERVRRRVEDALDDDERFELTYRLVTADGETRWVWTWGYGVEGGEVVEGHVFDVTGQTERKRELGLLTEAMNESSDGIVITDPDREDNPIVYANDGFLKLTGYDREEVLGRNCRFLRGPDTDDERVARMRETIRNREQVTDTVLHYRKDGTQFWNRVRIIPIRDDDGWLTNFVWFMQDVTGEVEQNRRLALLNRVLRHHVRNSMTHVLGGLELLAEETDPDRIDVERLHESGEELVQLSERAREIEQLFGGEQRFQSRPLSGLVAEAAEDVRSSYPRAIVDADLPAVPVLVDDRIGAALRELLVNAVEHNDREAPEVTVCALDRGTRDGTDVVRMAVADDGPPIPEADRRVLAEGEESQLRHGSGLGLWMVHWLVTLSGGSIAVEDRDPRGNVVVLELLVDE